MHTSHNYSSYTRPENAPIWKYMDLYKFEDLLSKKTLYFRLGGLFSDTTEGNISDYNEKDRYYPSNKPKEETHANINKLAEWAKNHIYVSCWNKDDELNDYMWENYIQTDEGICIETDMQRLKSSISIEKRPILIGDIKYVHDKRVGQSWLGIYDPFFKKDGCYSPENEVRMIVRGKGALDGPPEHPTCLRIKCDLDILIKTIYISPNSDQAVSNRVNNLVTSYGLSCTVVK